MAFTSGIFSASYLRRFLMNSKRRSDAQIMGVLCQAQSNLAVPELCREHNVSNASFYK